MTTAEAARAAETTLPTLEIGDRAEFDLPALEPARNAILEAVRRVAFHALGVRCFRLRSTGNTLIVTRTERR